MAADEMPNDMYEKVCLSKGISYENCPATCGKNIDYYNADNC
jgi:hypothetical protein